MKELFPDITINGLGGNHTRATTLHWPDQKIHSAPFSRLYYVQSGTVTIIANHSPLTLRPGHMYLIPAKTLLRLYLPEGITLDHDWLHFTCTLPAGLSLFDLLPCPFELPTSLFSNPHQVMTETIHLLHTYDPGDYFVQQANIRHLLAPFLTAAHQNNSNWRDQLTALDRFQPVLTYIDNNLSHSLTVKGLAKIINLHPTYFSNLFKEKFGLSPLKYINSQRLLKAQSLLLNSSKSIKEIALELGFHDEFYFSRLFTKTVKVPPSYYRRQKHLILPEK